MIPDLSSLLADSDAAGDETFDQVYALPIQLLSSVHWTPVGVSKTAAKFLVKGPETRVLDIGCGPGKFCAIGASVTEGHFTGVEQRARLVATAKKMLRDYEIKRVEILHANVLDINFANFDAFYLYNPFMENLFPAYGIGQEVKLHPEFYHVYTQYVQSQFAKAKIGTRLATYNCEGDEVPPGYDCMRTAFGGKLKLWIKARPDVVS